MIFRVGTDHLTKMAKLDVPSLEFRTHKQPGTGKHSKHRQQRSLSSAVLSHKEVHINEGYAGLTETSKVIQKEISHRLPLGGVFAAFALRFGALGHHVRTRRLRFLLQYVNHEFLKGHGSSRSFGATLHFLRPIRARPHGVLRGCFHRLILLLCPRLRAVVSSRALSLLHSGRTVKEWRSPAFPFNCSCIDRLSMICRTASSKRFAHPYLSDDYIGCPSALPRRPADETFYVPKKMQTIFPTPTTT